MDNPDKDKKIVNELLKFGTTCHLSKLSHEMNIPCIGGTGSATELLWDGQVITLDATRGPVYGERGEW